MKFGIHVTITDRTISATAAARAVEERGFESFWVPEHVHIPVHRESKHPVFGDHYPAGLIRCTGPFVTLGAAAGATSTINLGAAVCLVREHEPIALAKAAASLDHISGGASPSASARAGCVRKWSRSAPAMRRDGRSPKNASGP